MPAGGLLVRIAVSVFLAALGLSAVFDAIELFNQGRTLRAAALMAFGIALVGAGVMLVIRFTARI